MHLHQVFHVSLLQPYLSTSIPDRTVSPAPVIELAEGLEYEVRSILDPKIMRNKLYYLVDVGNEGGEFPLVLRSLLTGLVICGRRSVPVSNLRKFST